MRFHLVDRIREVKPAASIRVEKGLTLGEEYLADHFPTFPVMPGVLMLQSVVEASAWLLRISDDFRHNVVVLREAKNVKYGHLMEPGRRLLVSVELAERDGARATFKGKGEVDGQAAVSARVVLESYRLAERYPELASADERLTAHWRNLHALLTGGLIPAAVSAG